MIRTIIVSLVIVATVFQSGKKPDPVSKAIAAFASLNSYKVTLKTLCCGSNERILYTYKKPGFIRMDFINPHKGAALVYNPLINKVRLKPFGIFSFVVLTLDPDNSLIKNSKGHTIEKSDLGSLLANVNKLIVQGSLVNLPADSLNQRFCDVVQVIGKDTVMVDGIHVYKLWLDKNLNLPLKVEAFDTSGVLLESVLMDDLKINMDLDDDVFDL